MRLDQKSIRHVVKGDEAQIGLSVLLDAVQDSFHVLAIFRADERRVYSPHNFTNLLSQS